MTHYPEPQTDNLDNFQPVSSLIELTVLFQRFAAQMIGLRGIVGVMKNLARYERDLATARTHNVRVALKSTMLQIPKWRAKVLADLGGEAALLRWCKRLDVMCEPKTCVDRQVPRSTPSRVINQKVKSAGFKTDTDGLFRMAAINVPRDDGRSSHYRAQGQRRNSASLRPCAPTFKPIPLLPEELRGLTLPDYDIPPEIPDYRKFADDLIAEPEATDELVEGDYKDTSSFRRAEKSVATKTLEPGTPMQSSMSEPAWHPAKSLVPV